RASGVKATGPEWQVKADTALQVGVAQGVPHRTRAFSPLRVRGNRLQLLGHYLVETVIYYLELPPFLGAFAMAVAVAPTTSRVVRGACPHDCPDTCAMLVTVEDGRATRVAGDPDHPFTRGFLCAKVNRYIERTYHPDRLLYPMRRTGPKGSGQFERISWDEA